MNKVTSWSRLSGLVGLLFFVTVILQACSVDRIKPPASFTKHLLDEASVDEIQIFELKDPFNPIVLREKRAYELKPMLPPIRNREVIANAVRTFNTIRSGDNRVALSGIVGIVLFKGKTGQPIECVEVYEFNDVIVRRFWFAENGRFYIRGGISAWERKDVRPEFAKTVRALLSDVVRRREEMLPQILKGPPPPPLFRRK
jgi:hypothetical protein